MMHVMRKKQKGIPTEVKISSAYAVCSVVQKGLVFLTLPLFTRLLTTEQYGQSTIYNSWHSILSIFLTLNMAYGSFSAAMIKFEKSRDEYIASAEGISLVLAIIFLAIYLPLAEYWNTIFELPTVFIVLMVVELLSSNALLLWSGKKRFEFKYKSVIAVTLINACASPLLAYILVINTNEKGYAKIAGQALVSIAIGGSFFLFNIIKGKKIFDRTYWKYVLEFNIPLVIYYLSQVVFNASDRIMVGHYLGKDKAALYGFAHSLASMLTFVLSAINNSYVPWFYGKLKAEKEQENKTIACAIALLMAVMLLGIIWFTPEIIIIMAGEQYREAIWAVAPVTMSVLLLLYTQFFINIEFYYEEKGKLVWASIGAAVVNIVLNVLLIPRFGFVAAAYTTLASYFVFCYANYQAMKKILHKNGKVDQSYNYKWLIAILAVFLLIGFIGMLLYNYLVIRIFMAAFVLGVICINRKVILKYVKVIVKEGKYTDNETAEDFYTEHKTNPTE